MKSLTARLSIPVLCAVALAACGDGTAPSDASFDAGEAQADIATVYAVLNLETLESFQALGGFFTAASPVSPAAGALAQGSAALLAAGSKVSSLEAERELGAVASGILAGISSPSFNSVPIIADNVRGTTFVFDTTLGRYVADPGRTGAPADGIRYILYAVNPVTNQPLVDTEIGHADIIDLELASPNGISLQFIVVSDSVTHLDYTVTAEGTDESGTIAVFGFITDGTNTLQFTIDVAGRSTIVGQTVDVSFELTAVGRDFGFTLVFAGVSQAGAESADITLTVTAGTNTILIERSGPETAFTVSITVNGELFATAAIGPTGIVITGAGDRELTTEERDAFVQMLGLVERSLEALQGLMRPVDTIIRLAVLGNVL